jgi:hypothetical protein
MATTGILVTDTYPQRTPKMRLDEIVTEICKRVNDPFEDNYADRARELFVASAYQGIKDPKWTKFDYHGLVGARNFSNENEDNRIFKIFGTNNDITGDAPNDPKRRYVMDIVDVVSQEISEKNPHTRKYVPIDTSEANRIATDEDLEPIRGEVYWYIAGDRLYFHPSPGESMRRQNFIIEYLVNPRDFHINDDMLSLFSITYVYDAIDVTTGKLLAEIGLA